jgi:delta-aminolevulinic acid dehydratase/porphobilinogen synthase
MSAEYLKNLSSIAESLEEQGFFVEANRIHQLFLKTSSEYDKTYFVPVKQNLNEALNEFDSSNYELDTEGKWENTQTIQDFREETSDKEMHDPAAVDGDHIVKFDQETGDVDVFNVIPKHHLETLHNNPSDKSRFIKRAED